MSATAMVAKVSVLRTRLRTEAPSKSSASCLPSSSGLVAPASHAVSVSRMANAFLSSAACTRASWSGLGISTAAAMNRVCDSAARVEPSGATVRRSDELAAYESDFGMNVTTGIDLALAPATSSYLAYGPGASLARPRRRLRSSP